MDQVGWGPVAVAVVSVALAAAFIYHFHARANKPGASSPKPPSPPGYPLIGHIPYMLGTSFNTVHRQLVKWADTLGGVYLLNMAGPTYVVCDAALVSGVVLARGGEGARLPKAKAVYDNSLQLSFGTYSIFSDVHEGPYWAAMRKGMAPCFATSHLRAMYPTVRGVAERMVSLLREQPPGQPVLIKRWLQRCSLDMLGAAAFDKDFAALSANEDSPFFQVIHDAMEEFSLRLANPLRLPLQKLLPFTPTARRMHRVFAEYKKLFFNLLREFKARGEPAADDHSLWATLMRIKDPETGQAFPDATIAGNIATFLVAGFDSSTYTCMWALYDIAHHPSVQRDIVRELAAAGALVLPDGGGTTGGEAGGTTSRQLQYNELGAFPTLNAALKESMRVHSILATGTFRLADKPLTLGPYTVPKGAKLWVPFQAVHASSVNWTHPQEFDISRWQQQQQESGGTPSTSTTAEDGTPSTKASSSIKASISASPADYAPGVRATHTGHSLASDASFLPFSTGSRNCVGMSMGLMDVRTIMTALLSNFWVEVDTGATGSYEEVEEAQHMVLVLTSGRPIYLRLLPHCKERLAA